MLNVAMWRIRTFPYFALDEKLHLVTVLVFV